MTATTTLARVALGLLVPLLLCSGCMVRRVTITETLPTGALDAGDDPSTLSVDSAVLDGDLLEVLLMSQPVGCWTATQARADQVTIRKNKLDNNAPMGIGLLYGLGAVCLIPLVKAGDYDRSDWRTYGPVMAAGIGLLIAPSVTLLSTVPQTELSHEDVWVDTGEREDVPCPVSPATDVLLFLALPVAEGEPPPVPDCAAFPDRCISTDPEGRVLFDLTAAGFADEELARGEVGLFLHIEDAESALLQGFDITTTSAHAGAVERLAPAHE